MLNEDCVPTPLISRSERKAIRFVEPAMPRMRTVSIIFNILRWALDMVVLRLSFRWNSRSKGRVTKHLIERLGFLWIKLGQILSLRKDFFGKDFCDELSSLQNKATFFPFSVVKSIIHKDLGKPFDEVFLSFEEAPIAAASIAQVHRARLKNDSAQVVVKVMRPYAKEIFIKDLNFLRRCVMFLKHFNIWDHMRWDEAIWEIQHMMMEETDYRYEASNLKRYKKSLKKHKIYVPKVYPVFCTRSILVLEYVPGVLLSDFNDVYHTDPDWANTWCDQNKFDKKKAGLKLLLSFSRQIFEDNLYHADLHPGNIMLLKDSKMVLIDIGSVGTIEADLQRRFFSTIKALATKDYYKVADLMISFCPVLPMMDLTELSEELVRCLRDWEIKTTVKSIDYYEKSVTLVILEMVELMTVHFRLSIGWGFLKITRSWCNLESSLNCMIPRANNLDAFRVYFMQRNIRAIKYLAEPKVMLANFVSVPDSINEYRLFIEPRIRRASRVTQLAIKRGDHIIMGLSRLLVFSLATIFYLSLILSILLLSQNYDWMKIALYSWLPNELVDYLLLTGDRFVDAAEEFFDVSLSTENRWWWSVFPVIVAYMFWKKLRKFRSCVGDHDVQIDGFLNR